MLKNVESHLQEYHSFFKCTIITILLPSQCWAGESSLRLWLKFSEITERHWGRSFLLKLFICGQPNAKLHCQSRTVWYSWLMQQKSPMALTQQRVFQILTRPSKAEEALRQRVSTEDLGTAKKRSYVCNAGLIYTHTTHIFCGVNFIILLVIRDVGHKNPICLDDYGWWLYSIYYSIIFSHIIWLRHID